MYLPGGLFAERDMDMEERNPSEGKKQRNVGILAHVDAGKTTVTEQLMLLSGSIRSAGNVDSGTAVTDWLEVERRRGISVKTACALLEWEGNPVCLVDTPGHVDIAGEVERSLGVLDGAVLVISAVEGIQAHTELIWKSLRKLRIPTILFINKLDRLGADVSRVMEQIADSLTDSAFLAEEFRGQETEGCSVTCLLGESAPSSFREDLLLLMAQKETDLEERYLSGEEISWQEISSRFREACRKGECFPVLLGSAKLGIGIRELLDGILQFLPDASAQETEELSGIVFKVEHDPEMGKAAYVRLFGGSLKNRASVPVPGSEEGREEKITQIRRFSGRKYQDLGELHAGEIGALYGLSSLRSGDVLGKLPLHRECSLAAPLLMVRAQPESEEKRPALLSALRELSEEDPLLDLELNPETREMYVKITGSIQLEILEELLAERYGLQAGFSSPTVIYKETPLKPGRGLEVYTMPKPCWAVVELSMEPLEPGAGLQFRSIIKEKQLPYRYQHHVETSVKETLKQGIFGWEVTDALVTLTGGEHHHVHTHPLDFFVATPIAALRALTDCGSQLLEPFVRVRMSAGEEYLGKVLGQILDMRGVFDSPVIREGQFTLEAVLPVATSLEYPVTFRSLTSGRGMYSSQFEGYRPCPPGVKAFIPRRGVDPLDRPKWILHCRSALE